MTAPEKVSKFFYVCSAGDRLQSSFFNKRSFDLICLMESIEYMPDWREVFDLVKIYLRPGGGLYIKSHRANSAGHILNSDLKFRKSFHVGVPTRKTYMSIFEHEGIGINEVGWWPENYFRTMGLPFEIHLAAKVISKCLSPLINFMDRGGRVVICGSLGM